MALRLNTSEKNEIMPRRKARAEKPRLAQMLLRSGSLAGVESALAQFLCSDPITVSYLHGKYTRYCSGNKGLRTKMKKFE